MEALFILLIVTGWYAVLRNWSLPRLLSLCATTALLTYLLLDF